MKLHLLFIITFAVLTACKSSTDIDASVPTVVVDGRVISKPVSGNKPNGFNAGNIRIAWVIPNAETEVFSIANYGNSPASLIGWAMKDQKSWTWKLDSLSPLPARTQRILYSDKRQLVNNTGDTLSLLLPAQVYIQIFGFGATQPGDTVKAP